MRKNKKGGFRVSMPSEYFLVIKQVTYQNSPVMLIQVLICFLLVINYKL